MTKMIDARAWTREQLRSVRTQTVALVAAGAPHAEAAEKAGVSRETVCRWVAMERRGGAEALLATRKTGRPKGAAAALSGVQCAQIVNLIIDRTPEQSKLPFALWTCEAVGRLIQERSGVRLAESTVRLYLKRWGFTAQRPARRAREQEPGAVETWKRESWPKHRAEARRRGAMAVFLDETGLCSAEAAGTSYHPRGRTPALPVSGRGARLGICTAITPEGGLAFLAYRGTMDSRRFGDFLDRLDRHHGHRALDVVMDNHPVHKSRATKAWFESTGGRVRAIWLPPYCPETNPVELLNNDLKTNWMRRLRPDGQAELEAMADCYFETLVGEPERVKRFFEASSSSYVTAPGKDD